MAKAKVPNIYTQTVQQAEQNNRAAETALDVSPEEVRQVGQTVPDKAIQAKGRTLKQAAFAIGSERERKLDRLAFEYNEQRSTRINRNDIVRFMIDRLAIDDLLSVDLQEYKK
jgi:hypothetical protein